MNEFYELCGSNESEAARRLGVKAALFHRWRIGENAPVELSRPTIAKTLGISVYELMHGVGAIHEPPSPYGVALSDRAERLVKRLVKFFNTRGDEVLDFVENQLIQAEKIFVARQLDSSPVIPDVRLDPIHDRGRTAGVSADTQPQAASKAETENPGAVRPSTAQKRKRAKN